MTLHHRAMFYLILPLSIMAAVLLHATPVEAGSNVARTVLPERFLTLMQVSSYTHAAMQSATDSKKKTDASPEIPLPEGPGREVTKRICSSCHGIDVWAKQHHTSEQWSSIIDLMVSRGLQASDDELGQVNDYLAKYFPPLPKKDAPAEPSH
jgi:hypothetical protein